MLKILRVMEDLTYYYVKLPGRLSQQTVGFGVMTRKTYVIHIALMQDIVMLRLAENMGNICRRQDN